MAHHSHTIPPIPCQWEGCNQSYNYLNGLSVHVLSDHVGEDDVGCPECGFTTSSVDQLRKHQIDVHQQIGEPISARLAFVRYCRAKLRIKHPHLTDIPDGDFWQRGEGKYTKQAGKRNKALGRYSKIRERTRYQANPATTDNCPKCNTSVTPWTPKNFLHHLGKAHSVLVDLDFENVRSGKYPKYSFKSTQFQHLHVSDYSYDSLALEDYATTPEDEVDEEDEDGDDEDDEDEDEDEDEDDDENEDDDDDDQLTDNNDLSDSYNPIDNECSQRSGKDSYTQSSLASTQLTIDVTTVEEKFLSCVRADRREWFERVSTSYCTRQPHTNKTYLVKKCLSQDIDLETTDATYACHTSSGWHCEIPHCGATVRDSFLMKLHLFAHENTAGWYCAALSCQEAYKETCFEDRESLDLHVKLIHGDNGHAHTAARRFPRRDLFEMILTDKLNIRLRDNVSRVTNSPETKLFQALKLAITQHVENPDEVDRPLGSEIRAWQEYSKTTLVNIDVPLQDPLRGDNKYNSIYETLLTRHTKGSYVYLDRPPLPIDSSDEHPPFQGYWAVMVTGNVEVDKEGALNYLMSYEKLCESVSAETVGKFLEEMRVLFTAAACDNTLVSEKRKAAPETRYACPWPGCSHVRTKASVVVRHFVDIHIDCIWQCPQPGCEHCGYGKSIRLERHRMACHVGTPLQCGHSFCQRTFTKDQSSRGCESWPKLRAHLEMVFNQSLEESQPVSESSESYDIAELRRSLPSLPSYVQQFGGGSIEYLSETRRVYRKGTNLSLIGGSKMQVELRGKHMCDGFFIYGEHFPCVDLVYLGLETAMVLFVPSRMIFTIASTCDYCFHVMSQISRCYAQIPPPFTFSPANPQKTRKRQGVGACINDHRSFSSFVLQHPLPLPKIALKFKEIQKSSQKMFIVDFESLLVTKKGLPLVPTEVTFRTGSGNVILSSVINDAGMTNRHFENKMIAMGFDDPLSLAGARRIRKGRPDEIPLNSKTPKQIVEDLVEAGLDPNAYWVEWSSNAFDFRCMQELIKMAGVEPKALLPPPTHCWTVIAEFSWALPGLRSYALGRIGKLMNPYNDDLKNLHHSKADTGVLFDIIDRWFHNRWDVYTPPQLS